MKAFKRRFIRNLRPQKQGLQELGVNILTQVVIKYPLQVTYNNRMLINSNFGIVQASKLCTFMED